MLNEFYNKFVKKKKKMGKIRGKKFEKFQLFFTGTDKVAEVLIQYNANVNLQNKQGMTPLQVAIEFGEFKCNNISSQ